MNEILGYGEDAFTLWALKRRLPEILEELKDKTKPSDCLIFYRPSFGRRGGKARAEFGEFDAILSSSQNIYLIESKWDKKNGIELGKEQVRRHKIFSWYLENWDAQRYGNDWRKFESESQSNFAKTVQGRKIAPAENRLAENLEFVLNKLQEHCKRFSCDYRKPRNVLLYFHGNESRRIERVVAEDLNFEVVNINYSQYTSGNFITLDC